MTPLASWEVPIKIVTRFTVFWISKPQSRGGQELMGILTNRRWAASLSAALGTFLFSTVASANEAGLRLPDLSSVKFLGGINGHNLLLGGLVICVLGLVFGMVIYGQLKKMPV